MTVMCAEMCRSLSQMFAFSRLVYAATHARSVLESGGALPLLHPHFLPNTFDLKRFTCQLYLEALDYCNMM